MFRVFVSHWICDNEDSQILSLSSTSILFNLFLLEGKLEEYNADRVWKFMSLVRLNDLKKG